MWLSPDKLALSVFNSLNDIEKDRVKVNLDKYGGAFFLQFNYTEKQTKEFITELKKLLEVMP